MIAAHNHSGAAHNERAKRRRIPRARVIFITIDSLLPPFLLFFPSVAHPFLSPLSLLHGGNTAGIHRRMQPAGVDGMHRHCADLKVTRLTCIPARTFRTSFPVSSHPRRISTAGIPRNFPRYKRARSRRCSRRRQQRNIDIAGCGRIGGKCIRLNVVDTGNRDAVTKQGRGRNWRARRERLREVFSRDAFFHGVTRARGRHAHGRGKRRRAAPRRRDIHTRLSRAWLRKKCE